MKTRILVYGMLYSKQKNYQTKKVDMWNRMCISTYGIKMNKDKEFHSVFAKKYIPVRNWSKQGCGEDFLVSLHCHATFTLNKLWILYYNCLVTHYFLHVLHVDEPFSDRLEPCKLNPHTQPSNWHLWYPLERRKIKKKILSVEG